MKDDVKLSLELGQQEGQISSPSLGPTPVRQSVGSTGLGEKPSKCLVFFFFFFTVEVCMASSVGESIFFQVFLTLVDMDEWNPCSLRC